MKKVKNKFIVFIIFILSAVVWFLLLSPSNKNLDSNVTLKSWEAIILQNHSEVNLVENIPVILTAWDTLKTLSEESLAIIKWWDGSVTRLWGIWELNVEEDFVSYDKTQINIKFDLLAGKSWSNVLNYIPTDSHFIQTFNDHEAAVRGTIFDINLDKQYVYVTDHLVNITKPNGEKIEVWENKPFSLEKWDFISLLEFIQYFKDGTWTNINKNLDKLRLEDLQAEMLNTLQAWIWFIEYENITKNNDIAQYIRNLNSEEKRKKYRELLSEYQNLHFANSQTPELLDEKIKIKQVLVELADQENKERLMQSTLYDLDEVFKTNNPLSFERIIQMFEAQNEVIEKLKISLPDTLKFDRLSDEFTVVLQSRLETMKQKFDNVDFNTIPTITPEMLKNLQNSADQKVQDFLNNNLDPEAIKNFWNSTLDTFNSLFKNK